MVCAGSYFFLGGNMTTTVNVGDENPDTELDVTFDGQTIPYLLDETFTIQPDNHLDVYYPIYNNENFPVTVTFTITDISDDLSVNIYNALQGTLTSITIPANDMKYIHFDWMVSDTATQGDQLTATVEITLDT